VVSGPLSVVSGTLEARDESGRLVAMHSPSLGACPDRPDAQATEPIGASPDQPDTQATEPIGASPDQPDAQAREPEVHHALEGQGLSPSLARRVGVDPDVSDVILSGESPDGGSPNETNEPTAAHDITTSEPTDAAQNETNEPTIGPLSVVRCQLPMVGCAVEEIVAQNETNEPTTGSLSVVRGPLSVGTCVVEAIDKADATNEPTKARENETNEPKLAAESVGSQSVELSVGADDKGEEAIAEGFSVEQSEAIQRGCEKIRLARVESLRKLNEEARKEAEQAMALRRSRLSERRKQNGKPGDPPKGREARSGQTRKKETAGRNKEELDKLVNMVLELQKKLVRRPPN
jgi:hypothetical protein